jgi:COX assembly mitochondrial protein 2
MHQGCEEVMNALEECHARGFLFKAVGGCNDAKTAVNKCLRAERIEHTKANRDTGVDKKTRIKQLWAEVDANS